MIIDKTILETAILNTFSTVVPSASEFRDTNIVGALAQAIANAILKLQDGTINMDNVKKGVVEFITEFDKVARVSVSVPNTAPNYSVVEGKTGFTITFASNYTGIVEWTAIERA